MNSRYKKYLLVLLPILIVSIGFAVLSAQFGIFGSLSAKAPTWNIYFSNLAVTEGSVTASTPVINNNNHSITYGADIKVPGEFYEFKVDVVNEGSIDAMINTFTNDISATTPSYIKYEVTYGDGSDIKQKQYLRAGETVKLLVRVEVLDEITTEDFSTDDIDVTATLSLEYVRADDTAIERERGYICDNEVTNTQAVCRRAKKLNYELCNSGYCKNSGYSTDDKVIYGTCGAQGEEPVAGDAFDCDVDNSGTFDADERFYYISDSGSNEGYATLIYYKNVGTSAYYSSSQNYNGPVALLNTLPSTTEWSNPGLNTEMTRQIVNELGTNTSYNGRYTLPEFTYTGRAARLLTAQEVNSACGITVGSNTHYELITCQYLLENTTYSTNSESAFWWLETPYASNNSGVWRVSGDYSYVYTIYSNLDISVRPAIEVDKTKIDY